MYIWNVASMTEKLDLKLLASFDVSLNYHTEVVFVISLLSKILRISFLRKAVFPESQGSCPEWWKSSLVIISKEKRTFLGRYIRLYDRELESQNQARVIGLNYKQGHVTQTVWSVKSCHIFFHPLVCCSNSVKELVQLAKSKSPAPY